MKSYAGVIDVSLPEGGRVWTGSEGPFIHNVHNMHGCHVDIWATACIQLTVALWPQYTDIGLLQRLQGSSLLHTLHTSVTREIVVLERWRTVKSQVPCTNEVHV